MPPKRPRLPSQEGEAPSGADKDQRIEAFDSPKGFHLLPLELKQHVIRLACLVSSFSSPSSSPSPFGLDSGTMFNLSLVCRDINAHVSPLLWRHVSLLRPSALYNLVEALEAQPSTAKTIQSLHIGQYDTLPSFWWPLSTVQDEAGVESKWIASSLPRDCLPAGCEDREGWRWDHRPEGGRQVAVYEALDIAQRSLGISLQHDVGQVATKVEPIFELQAVLDLYLMEVRRREQKNHQLRKAAYPTLVLTDVPSRATQWAVDQAKPISNAFILPYTELLRHLARPGALTDRFDHPLTLERSTMKIRVEAPPLFKPALAKSVASRATFSIHHESWLLYAEQGRSNWQGVGPLQDAIAKGSGQHGTVYALALGTATLGSVLCLTRKVLYAPKSLQNVSLTGYLQQAMLVRSRPSLLRASIGPTALPGWDAFLPMRGLKLVKQLRLCGKSLRVWETHQIAAMTWLRQFEYSLWEPFGESEDGSDIEVFFDHLLRVSDATLNASDSEDEEQSDARGTKERDLPLIIARLVPEDTMRVLAEAPSEDHRAACSEGLPMPGAIRRLLLKQNDVAVGVEGREVEDDGASNSIDEVMYEDGRRYWRGIIDV